MKDQELREKMGQAGQEKIAEYTPDVVWSQWEALLSAIVRKRI